jgi:hypothetical protein
MRRASFVYIVAMVVASAAIVLAWYIDYLDHRAGVDDPALGQ